MSATATPDTDAADAERDAQGGTAVAEPPETKRSPKKRPRPSSDKPRQQPPYHVVLLNDDHHTYEYVIRMLGRLFHHSRERAYRLACEVDRKGRAVVYTTAKEVAELKVEQVHAFGRDPMVLTCQGSMTAVLEPAA